MTWESSKSLESMGQIILSACDRSNAVQVIIGPKHIGWDRRGEVAPEFITVSADTLLQRQLWADINTWPTGWRHRPSSLRTRNRSCSRGAVQDVPWTHREGTRLYLGTRKLTDTKSLWSPLLPLRNGGRCH